MNKRRRERRRENLEKTKAERKRDGEIYRERHKEKLKEIASTKIECECGGKYTLCHKADHMNSKKHLKYLGTFDEDEYKQSKRAEQLITRYEKKKTK